MSPKLERDYSFEHYLKNTDKKKTGIRLSVDTETLLYIHQHHQDNKAICRIEYTTLPCIRRFSESLTQCITLLDLKSIKRN